jgi:hypothetical protein
METPQHGTQRVSTGILSKSERAFFQGDHDVQDPDGYRRNARHRARKRMEQIEQDLEVLREAGEDDIVAEFYENFGRVGRLEQEIEELRAKLENTDE